MKEIKTVYIAGPYTKGDVAQNVANAIKIGNQLLNLGFFPFIPHLTHFWHMMHSQEYKTWMDLDDVWLSKCDALFRISGEHNGADTEEYRAISVYNIPVYDDLEELRIYKENLK